MEDVEDIRALAKKTRQGNAPHALMERLSQLETKSATSIGRAFAQFLALANIAEQHPEITNRLSRELRTWQRSVLNSLREKDYPKK